MRVVRARDMRSFGRKGQGIMPFTSLVGTLFLRTVERAEKIYQAMLSRGFRGRLHAIRPFDFRAADTIFLAVTVILLCLFRVFNIAGAAGRFSSGLF